ncbi:MAG: hypothetical protein ABSF99_01045 [Anaerolineales bacterium]|jgi:hypothetical protein
MYTKDLSANVPLYGQEQCYWCGAASAQMSRNGYPNAANRLFYTQQNLWNIIQVYNSTVPADQGWATDPEGLQGCLQSLANPPSVGWDVFADANQNSILFDILYWINQREYPAPILINKGGHWVVIVGFETDVEPIDGSTPTLQSITINDPEPHNIGTHSQFTAAQWFSGPWNGTIDFAGTWYQKYVAVVEPPIKKGMVMAKTVKRTGKELLSPAQALEYAQKWIAEMGLAEKPQYRLLADKNVNALEPVLVREEIPGIKAEEGFPHYYIVPFGNKSELHQRGVRAVRVCVLVNAYTGNFEEVTTFGAPIRYLPKQEALQIVSAALQAKPSALRNVQAELVFQSSDITHIRTYPFWQITLKDRIVYVDQLGRLYGKLLPSIPGD